MFQCGLVAGSGVLERLEASESGLSSLVRLPLLRSLSAAELSTIRALDGTFRVSARAPAASTQVALRVLNARGGGPARVTWEGHEIEVLQGGQSTATPRDPRQSSAMEGGSRGGLGIIDRVKVHLRALRNTN